MISLHASELAQAKNTLDQNNILAVPTETVYGLAVQLDNPAAITKLLQFKNRQSAGDTKMLTLMLHTATDVPKYATLTPVAEQIIATYFPGELTVILPKNPDFKHPYFDHHATIGIRIPDHKFMLQLLQTAGPLLVTSANRRGDPPCIDSDQVAQNLPEIDALIVGRSGNQPPSTVLDLTTTIPKILRQGRLTIKQ